MSLLSAEERHRFADWLEEEAETAEGLVAQMKQMNAPDVVWKQYSLEAAANLIVARRLRATESMTVRGQ